MAHKTGLAEYLISRYDAWKQNMGPLRQKWQNNLNAMKQEDNETRKKFKHGEKEAWRSDAYIGITKSKVFTVFALIAQVLFPRGQIPFKLNPSPYQKNFMGDQESEILDDRIDKMEDKIREQQADRKADRESMLKVLSLLIYGMCVSKYNLDPIERSGFRQKDLGVNPEVVPYMDEESARFEEWRDTENVPGHVYTSLWNMFWDMEGSEGLQKCGGYCEKQMVSPADLKAKIGKPFYLESAIRRAITEKTKDGGVEDPQNLPPGQREISERKKNIRNLEFWCRAPKSLVRSFLADLKNKTDPDEWDYIKADEAELEADEVEVMAEMAGDEIVRIALNESGKRPHREAKWELMLDEAGGAGLPDNGDGVQYLFNGILRSAMDNFRLAANVGLGIKSRYFKDPSQLDKPLEPGFRLDIADSCDDARKAMQQIIIQDVSAQAIPWLQQAWSWKDTVFNVPDILQGSILPQQKGDTAYEWSQRLDFGSKYIGLGINNFDQLIEDEVKDLYLYNMRNPDFKGGKGDYIVHPSGYQSFQEKLVRTQQLKELLGMLLASEALGVYAKIRPHLEQLYRNMDIDPDDFLRTEEEIQEMQARQEEQQRQMMEAERAAKAEEAQTKLQQEAMKGEMDRQKAEEDFQRDIIKEGIKELTGGEKKPAKK